MTKLNEAKILVKYISCNLCNANLIVNHLIQIKNEIMINLNASYSKYNHRWNPRKWIQICENSSYLKSNTFANNKVIMWDEIKIDTESVSTCDKYYIKKSHEYCFNKFWWQKK